MAKELKKQDSGEAIVPAAFAESSATFEGDQSAALGRAAMCYGTPEEEAMYGPIGAKRGILIDTLEKRELASATIVPVYGWEDRCCWPKGAKSPTYVYKHKDYHRVPEEHKGWTRDAQGNDVPPIAPVRYNWVVFVVGEKFPYLMTFKRTGAKAGEFIRIMEHRRAMMKLGSAMYAMTLTDDKSKDGKSYKRLTASVAGNVPADLIPTIIEARAQLKAMAAQAETLAAETDTHDGDEVPF